jgi:hypothetical protein
MDAKALREGTRALLLGVGAIYAVSTPPAEAQAYYCADCAGAFPNSYCTWTYNPYGFGGSYCSWQSWQGEFRCGTAGRCIS